MSALELVDSGDGALNGESLIPRNRVLRLHLSEGRSMVEEALGACLLPSLQLVPANPAAGQEIWEVMSLLPYEVGLTLLLSFALFLYFLGLKDNMAKLLAVFPRCDIVYMVNGKKMMSGIHWFWLQGKQPRYHLYILIYCCKLGALSESYPIHLYLLVFVLYYSVIMQLDTRRILKRLAKENLKQLGRMVAKLAHANPMTVLRTIVHQVLVL